MYCDQERRIKDFSVAENMFGITAVGLCCLSPSPLCLTYAAFLISRTCLASVISKVTYPTDSERLFVRPYACFHVVRFSIATVDWFLDSDSAWTWPDSAVLSWWTWLLSVSDYKIAWSSAYLLRDYNSVLLHLCVAPQSHTEIWHLELP